MTTATATAAPKQETYAVRLTGDELMILDGKCSARVQSAVDVLKVRRATLEKHAGLEHAEASSRFIAEVIAEARDKGWLTWLHGRVAQCRICGVGRQYSTYRSGRNRGKVNYSKGWDPPGVELAHRFVFMKHRFVFMKGHRVLGACTTCVERLVPVLQAELAGIQVELPAKLRSPGATIWKRFPNRKCSLCEWTGHEGQMGKLPTLMMGGYYPAKCPRCPAENTFGYNPVAVADGFTMVQEEGA